MARVTRFLERKLRLKVNETKSAVARPWNRTFLGFTFTRRRCDWRQVSEKALKAFKAKVREFPGRTRGRTIRQIVQELRQLLLGWRGFFGFAEGRSLRRDLDKWSWRRLRSSHWKQWGRRGDRERRKRGVGRQLAWNTATSAHGPWRLSQSPAPALLRRAWPAKPGRGLIQPLHPPNRRIRDPYVRWCGRAGAARFPPIPIGLYLDWAFTGRMQHGSHDKHMGTLGSERNTHPYP